jgi:hypothetical protein
MHAEEFVRRFKALLGSQRNVGSNSGLVACHACEGCHGCTFCTRGKNLLRCHHCEDAEQCIECQHCSKVTRCIVASHCVECSNCVRSKYLTRCQDCTDCTFCFGCIGLSSKDFHILNEPYDRETYFRLTSELARSLRIAMK